MTEWDVFLVVGSVVSFVAVFAGVAWKFGAMITKLQGLIENLAKTIERIEEDQKSEHMEIMGRLDDHDIRIRQTELTITELTSKIGDSK